MAVRNKSWYFKVYIVSTVVPGTVSIHKRLLNEDSKPNSLLRMQFMVFVVASDFNRFYSLLCQVRAVWWRTEQDGFAFCLLFIVFKFWEACPVVAHSGARVRLWSVGTLRYFPHPPQAHKLTLPSSAILHSSRAGHGLSRLYLSGACSGTWPRKKTWMTNLAHCSSYLDTL